MLMQSSSDPRTSREWSRRPAHVACVSYAQQTRYKRHMQRGIHGPSAEVKLTTALHCGETHNLVGQACGADPYQNHLSTTINPLHKVVKWDIAYIWQDALQMLGCFTWDSPQQFYLVFWLQGV